MNTQTLKHKTLWGTFWMLTGTGGQQVANFVIMLVLARNLGPAAFGLVGIAEVFIEILTLIGRAGLTEVVIQKQDASQKELSTLFWTSLFLGIFLALCLFFGAPLLAQAFEEPGLDLVMKHLSVACVFNTLGTVHEGLLRRNFGFKALAVRNLTAAIVSGVVAIVLALEGFGAMSLVAQRVVLTGWLVGALWVAVRWVPSFEFSMRLALKNLRVGSALAGSSLLGTGNQRIIDLLVGYFLGTTALGYLRIAFKGLDLLFNLCVTPVTSVATTLLSHLQNDRPALIHAYLRLVQLTSVIIYPVFLGSAVVAPEFVHLAFGAQWEPSVILMQLFTPLGLFVPLAYYRNNILLAVGRTDHIFFFSVISFVVSVSICLVSVQIGVEATALGNALRVGFMTPITLYAAKRYAGVDSVETLTSVVPAAVASLVMVAALWTLKLMGAFPASPAYSMGMSVTLGGVIYAGVLFVFFRSCWDEVMKMMPVGVFGRIASPLKGKKS